MPRMARRHVPALDGLRAIAVTSVIVFHARSSGGGHAYEWIASAGWIGVDLFFVLSGFLITGILLEAKGKPRFFRTFYLRRTLRIFPLYYAVLVACLLIAPHFVETDPRILHEQGWLWTYTTNINVLRHGGMIYTSGWLSLTHFWSLAIEEQFYLVWPLLVYLLPRRGLAAVAGLIVAGAPIARVLMLRGGVPPDAVYEFTVSHLDALAVGALCAVYRPVRWASWMIAIGAGGVLIVVGIAHRFELDAYAVQTAGLSALAICFGGIVVRASQGVRWLEHPVMVRVGMYSYGIYVFHALLLPLYRWLWSPNPIVFTIFVLVATTLVAAASWHLFERRFLVLKERVAAVEDPSPAS